MIRKRGRNALPEDVPVPRVEDRPLLSGEQAQALAGLFKNFANDTRLRLLHALVREGELCVTDLADAVGMKPQAVSNQLQRLVDRGLLSSERNGNNVYYRIADPCVPVLLERGLCLIECHPL
jgi:DNA-binding transcriptional ArsR family regulator